MKLHVPSKRTIAYAVFGAIALLSAAALGSGSISSGTGGVTQYGAIYTQGKKVFFGKLACSRAECPIKRNEVDAALAESVVRTIWPSTGVAPDASRYDAAVGALTSDEQAMVAYYLSRRFGIDT